MQNKLSKDLQAKEWIQKATDDELNARSILTHRDGTPSGVCFLSQQAAEKYLKAFLVYRRKWYPKIHLLDALWEFCQEMDKSFDEIKGDAVYLTSFYASARYPGDYPEFIWKDADKALKAATKIKNFVISKLNI